MIVVDPYSSQLLAKGGDHEHIFGSGKERNQDVLRFRQYKEWRKVQESGTEEQWNQTLNEPCAVPAAAKSLQLCPTLYNPIDGSPPGSLSLGFSRQEHWSGLPFPSPMHESEMWKWSRSVMCDSLQPHGLQPTRFLCPWDFPGKSTGVGCLEFGKSWVPMAEEYNS